MQHHSEILIRCRNQSSFSDTSDILQEVSCNVQTLHVRNKIFSFQDLRDGIIITRTVNMEPFDEGVVRDVIYWMYTGKLFLMDVPHYNLAEFWDVGTRSN